MSAAATLTGARESIERLAAAPLSCEQFQWQAAAQLRRVVGFDALCWTLVDPGSGLPSWVVANNPVIASQQRRLHQLYPPSETFPRPTSSMISVLSTDTGDDLARDDRWRELFGPGNLGDVLTAGLAAGGACWGMLHLYREQGRRWFNHADVEAVAGVSTTLARRLRFSLISPLADGAVAASGAGTIILDRALELVATTAPAKRWLHRLPPRAPAGPEPLPGFIYALATRAAQPGGPSPTTARLRIRASDGTWLVLHAAPLSDSAALGTGAVAITIEPAAPAELRSLLMRAYRLSGREREVAGLVLGGLPNPEVAGLLFITRNTVTDHLKAIYAKVRVSNRGDLGAVLSGHPQPTPEHHPDRGGGAPACPAGLEPG